MARNILIMSLTRMGDLVQATPVLEGVRERHPGARITLLVSSDFEACVPLVPGVDEALVFDLRQFSGQQFDHQVSWITVLRYLERFMEDLRARRFDHVVNLSHSKLSALMILYLGIPSVTGFACNATGDRMSLNPWMQFFATEPFNRVYNPFNLAEIFIRSGDVDPAGRRIRIREEVGAEDSIRETVEREGLREEEWVVGIHAGASLEDRRWPAASFADLADRLADRWNARILLFGVRSESALAEEIMQRMQRKDRVLNLTGQTRLAQLVAWLKRCRYLVSNDTGPMHLAAALGVKIVGLFFAHAHPYETAPYVPGNLIFQARIPCAPCSYGVHCNHIVCIHKVTPEQVCSMVETHARAGKWEVPPGLGSLPEVHIFETGTDPEDLLVLRPLLRHPVTLDDVFRTGYARLWPHVLSDIPGDLDEQRLTSLVSQLRNDYDCRLLTLLLPKIQEKIGVLQKLREWAEQGIRTAEQILQIEPGTGRGISPLKQLGDTVSRVDEEIGRIACTHPEIRPLADLFAKRKENLQGEDVRALAQGSQECYAKLDRESSFLRKILERVIREFEAGADGEGQAETRSIKAAVPGR